MKWSLAIHGGAGIIERDEMSREREAEYRNGLTLALLAGEKILIAGGTSLDAVEASVRELEDNPIFNAGRGAVYTEKSTIELDAAIMDGKTTKAGAVAGVTRTKNPISLARAVLEKTNRLFIGGNGADDLSISLGLEQVGTDYFHTALRARQFEKWQARQLEKLNKSHLMGTVGAVALDSHGNLAAATSTGGTTGKMSGRIGDTPIIGAGTIAINGLAAVSCTGTGEYFIRESAARQICDRIKWNGQNIHEAAYETIMAIGAIGGDGGLIAMDANGDVAFAINDMGMYRGWVADGRKAQTSIYPGDVLRSEGREGRTSNEMH
jgi:beta-aspartyl-peptidase (threonine type)